MQKTKSLMLGFLFIFSLLIPTFQAVLFTPVSVNASSSAFDWFDSQQIKYHESSNGNYTKSYFLRNGTNNMFDQEIGSNDEGGCQDAVIVDFASDPGTSTGKNDATLVIRVVKSANNSQIPDSEGEAIQRAKDAYQNPDIKSKINSARLDGNCYVINDIKTIVAEIQNSTKTPAGTGSGGSGSNSEVDCEGSSVLGWIICPIIEGLYNGANTVTQSFVIPLLQVRALDTSGNLYKVWKGFRTIANIFFVIVFFVIIFSTAINNRQG